MRPAWALAIGPTWPSGPVRMLATGEPRVPPEGAGSGEFEARFREHAADVGRLCRRLLSDGPAAEDAAQEVFLRARRGYASYDAARPFRPWLLGIAGHHCVDVLRRRGREAGLFDAGDLEPEELAADAPSPLSLALDAETRARVLDAIDALPPRERVLLTLRHFQELDYESIASVLGISRNHVGVLLTRARAQLRRSLSGDDA